MWEDLMLILTAKFGHSLTEFTPSQEIWIMDQYNIADSGIKPSLLKCFGWISPDLPTKQLRPPAEKTPPLSTRPPKNQNIPEEMALFLGSECWWKIGNQAGSSGGWHVPRKDSDVREIYLPGNAAASEVHSRYGKSHWIARARWHVNI